MFFTHPIGLIWLIPSTMPLKDTLAPNMTKAKNMELDKEKDKIHNALGQFTNDWTKYGVSFVSNHRTNVRGGPLVNVLGVFAIGVIFLATHDYLDHYHLYRY